MSPSGFPGYPTPLDGALPVAQRPPTRVRDKKATVRPRVRSQTLIHAGPPGPGVAPRRLFLAAAAVLFLVAAALGVLAFTRFDEGPPPSGSPGAAGYETGLVRDARLSVALGLASAFALVGALACLDRGRRPSSLPPQP